MSAIGIDLVSRVPRIVQVDAHGAIVRSTVVSGTDAAGGIDRALGEALGSGDAGTLGIAADDSDPGSVERARDLASMHGGRVFAAGAAVVTAEAWTGAAAGARHVIALWLGDRVLAGILLNGEPWSGAHGRAGAAAWLALNPVERQDYRQFGGLAAEVSNKGIARRLSWRIQAGDQSSVLDRAGDLDAITATHVYEGARSGDGVSISVVRETARYIAMAIANLVATLDPEVVVVAGAASAAGDLLLEPVRHECARRLPPAMADSFRCEISPLGEDGIAAGAARLASVSRA